MQKFSFTSKSTFVVYNIASSIHPHIIIRLILELTVSEVHVTIREKLSIESATLHVDCASMLETVIVNIVPIKGYIIECCTIRHTGNAAICRSMCK